MMRAFRVLAVALVAVAAVPACSGDDDDDDQSAVATAPQFSDAELQEFMLTEDDLPSGWVLSESAGDDLGDDSPCDADPWREQSNGASTQLRASEDDGPIVNERIIVFRDEQSARDALDVLRSHCDGYRLERGDARLETNALELSTIAADQAAFHSELRLDLFDSSADEVYLRSGNVIVVVNAIGTGDSGEPYETLAIADFESYARVAYERVKQGVSRSDS